MKYPLESRRNGKPEEVDENHEIIKPFSNHENKEFIKI